MIVSGETAAGISVRKGTLIECDVLEDMPGIFTAARIRYDNGTEYRITHSEFIEPDELSGILAAYVPPFRVLLNIEKTDSLGCCEDERTLVFWVME